MNPYFLRFFDTSKEKDYRLQNISASRSILCLLNFLIMLFQFLGLFLILSKDDVSLIKLIFWIFIPILSLLFAHFLFWKGRCPEVALFVQRMQVTIYFMELILPYISNDPPKIFLLGLVSNCIYLNWGDGGSWLAYSFEVVISNTYYFIRTCPNLVSSESSAPNVCMYLIVVLMLIANYYKCEKNHRKLFSKMQKLLKEKQFWRIFMENTYQEPSFIIKLSNNSRKRKSKAFSVKSLLKGKFKYQKNFDINNPGQNGTQVHTTTNQTFIPNTANGEIINVKPIKRPEFALGLSNSASRNKLSVFVKDDLVELFRNVDLVRIEKSDQPSKNFEEVLSELACSSVNRLLTANYQNKNDMVIHTYLFNNNVKQNSCFKKGRIFIGLIAGDGISKNLEILITVKVEEFEDEIEKLKELDKAKDKILANVTHDLRSPLNGIMNFIEQAMETEDTDERNKLLDYAKINSDLLLNLINDILDLSQQKEGRLRIGISTFGVIKLAEEVLKLMEFKAVSKGVKLFLSTNLKEEKICESDPKRLKQVLINLISNSLKFTNKGFIRLVINSTTYKNVLKFEVYDTGCGIKKELINKLFNPYVTFSEFGNNNYGIGLGLTICQSIVQLLGPSEKMFVSSIYGRGTKIGFLFFTNQDKSGGSLPKNSLNLSEKSVTISKDSQIIVTTGQQNRSPDHRNTNKGTPNFMGGTLSANSKVESTIFSKFQRSVDKKIGDYSENDEPLAHNSDMQKYKSSNSETSPPLARKKPTPHRRNKKKDFTHIMEGLGVTRTMTIKNADIKNSNNDFSYQMPQNSGIIAAGQSNANSSSLLSRSIRLNCSEYFTTFSVIEAESITGYEVVHNGKTIDFLQEGKSRDDSSNIEKWESGDELEELENGEQINKPSNFFHEDLSFFSSEHENNYPSKLEVLENQKTSEDPFELHKEKKKIENIKKDKVKEPSFGERSLALKNVRLEKIEEDANEESKQELKTSHKRTKSKSKKAFTFIERSPRKDDFYSKNSLHVMVVDDDPFNTMILCRFIEKLDLPVKVERGCNGQEALDLFKMHNRKNEAQRPFHMIFLDCQMPIMNGYEAAKNIKECIKTGVYENTVVIAVTAYNIQDEEEKCLLAGMDAVLMKPVSEWEFRQLVNKFLVFEAPVHSKPN